MTQHTSRDFAAPYHYRFRVVEVPADTPTKVRIHILAYNGINSFIIADNIWTRRDANWICELMNTSVEAAYWTKT